MMFCPDLLHKKRRWDPFVVVREHGRYVVMTEKYFLVDCSASGASYWAAYQACYTICA